MGIQQQRGISRKWYLQLDPPTEEDNRSCQKRILDEVTQRLKESGEENHSCFYEPAGTAKAVSAV